MENTVSSHENCDLPDTFYYRLEKVREFHAAFKIPFALEPNADVQKNVFEMRHRILAEENDEYLEACQAGDLTKIADALGDLLYVLFGTVVTHGLQDKLGAVFDEIHRSNMSKLGPDGQPIYREDGKILKGPDYFPPELKDLL